MQRSLIAALAAFVLGASVPATAATEPIAGYDRLTIQAPHRALPIAASIWYPAGTRTYRGLVGDNPLFNGASALVGAAIADGTFPLVLLSHGSGGRMDGLAWLASALALDGAVVLGVDHQGSTSGDSSPRRSIELGDRTRDLEAALDHVLADPVFAASIDASRITAIGFSLGGTTVLNLAGARLDRERYADYCARLGDAAIDCRFFERGGVDLSRLPERIEADLSDPRVTAVVAIDPGMTYGFTEESVAAIELPLLLITLGETHRWAAADVSAEGSGLVELLPDARHRVIAPASHFTFLATCKPGAAQMLAAEADDPICDDPPGTDRDRVHASIVAEIKAFMVR